MAQTPLTEDLPFAENDLLLTKMVAANRSLVWRLWTESRHLAQWWGPHGFTNPECIIEPRPGGRLHILMRSPDGEQFLNVGTIRVADAPERLVFTIAMLGGDGKARLENLTTVDFAERGAATEVTVRVRILHATVDARPNVEGMNDGWSESLERLASMETKGIAL